MSIIINDIANPNLWCEFLEYKLSHSALSSAEENQLREFIENKKYLSIANKLRRGELDFSVPIKHEINKSGSTKKRAVYTFTQEEMYALKFINFRLYKYDCLFCDNLYSFRKSIGAKQAVKRIINTPNVASMSCFKFDIKDYFNSIDLGILLSQMKKAFYDDIPLYAFFEKLLTKNQAAYSGELIKESRGVMAGTPTAGFFADLYLTEMDEFFLSRDDVVYIRYSDDVAIFASPDGIAFYENKAREFIEKYKLSLNESKTILLNPGEGIDFLGFNYNKKTVDISGTTIRKLKGKIRRSARSLNRWCERKQRPYNDGIRLMIRKFNRKFYYEATGREFCWARWFFPVINTDKGLKEIDDYMQMWLRYLATGRHSKKNFELVPYTMLKEYGYVPLVSGYYKRKKDKERQY